MLFPVSKNTCYSKKTCLVIYKYSFAVAFLPRTRAPGCSIAEKIQTKLEQSLPSKIPKFSFVFTKRMFSLLQNLV